MEARSTRRRWTYADYAHLPMPSETGGTRYEVIDHELYVTPSPGRSHQEVVGHLFWLLYGFARAHGLGKAFVSPFDVLFAEGDYLEPDIVFVRKDHARIVTERGIEGAPDLVVEVLSPSTASRDRGIKLDRYRLYGVQEYWMVDPDGRTVEIWRLADRAERPLILDQHAQLEWTPEPGATLLIDLKDLFEG
jgi:Uma2 family endonuclease